MTHSLVVDCHLYNVQLDGATAYLTPFHDEVSRFFQHLEDLRGKLSPSIPDQLLVDRLDKEHARYSLTRRDRSYWNHTFRFHKSEGDDLFMTFEISGEWKFSELPIHLALRSDVINLLVKFSISRIAVHWKQP